MTTMVLIHGAWVTSLSWEFWTDHFEKLGYEVLAPEWPRKDVDAQDLKADPETLACLGIGEIVDRYADMIAAMDDPPVIVGHSFGGLFTQLLLDRGLGKAGVALDPAPPKGVLTVTPAEFKANSPVILHPSNREGVVTMTYDQFRYGFVNTYPEDEAKVAYERYVVPETGRIFFQDGLAEFSLHSPVEIDFGNPDRAPLLITGGGKDHTVPAAVTNADYYKYRGSQARTDYHEFPDAPHLLIAGPSAEEVAAYVAGWLDQVLAE